MWEFSRYSPVFWTRTERLKSAANMTKVDIRPLSDLREALPALASAMSMSRANMVIDQLMSLVGQKRFDEIIFISGESSAQIRSDVPPSLPNQAEGPDSPEALPAGVVVYHPSKADFATMLVAGWALHFNRVENDQSTNGDLIASACRTISEVLDPLLYERGVRFLQFATDVIDCDSDPVQAGENSASFKLATLWQRGLGFQHIGDLEYQSGSIDKLIAQIGAADPQRIELRPMTNIDDFAKVVERTYSETMDCPAMAKFRTTEETLCGYQQTDAYNPKLWFSLHQPQENSTTTGQAIGCLVMGVHKNHQTTADKVESTKVKEPTLISELVYMGLIPEARGSGLGKDVIEHAARVSKQIGAERMILAVDETNNPARNLYRNAGMAPLMREAVWGKRIESK